MWNVSHAIPTSTPSSCIRRIRLCWFAICCNHEKSARSDQCEIALCGTVCVTTTQSQLRTASSLVTNLIPSDSFHIISTSSPNRKKAGCESGGCELIKSSLQFQQLCSAEVLLSIFYCLLYCLLILTHMIISYQTAWLIYQFSKGNHQIHASFSWIWDARGWFGGSLWIFIAIGEFSFLFNVGPLFTCSDVWMNNT